MTNSVLEQALSVLNDRLKTAKDFGSVIKFEIESEGCLYVNGTQSPPVATLENDQTVSCTVTAEAAVLQGVMTGNLSAMAALMSGKLRIDGEISNAMAFAKSFS